MRNLLTEIIRKECERYDLIDLEVIRSIEEGVDILSSVWPLSDDGCPVPFPLFVRQRRKALNRFYYRLGYKEFLKRESRSSRFVRFLFFFQRRLLGHIRKAYYCPTLDRELAVSPHTIAFKLSRLMSETHRDRLLFKLQGLNSPYEMEKCCRLFLENHFPLPFDTLLTYLQKEDKEYWEELFLLIRNMAVRIASRLYPSLHYKKEIEHDTWSETSLFLYRKTVEKLLPFFETALHFRHYILRICTNKCHEAERIHRMKHIVGEESIPLCLLSDEEMVNEGSAGWTTECWEDIDPDNNAAVSRALTAILWDRTEPWYTRLTKGVEDKVEILFLHYVSGKSYAEIARIQETSLSPKSDLSPEQLQKRENKLRQEVVRVRKTLKERFIRFLKTSEGK